MSGSPRILVVDDDPKIRTVVRRGLGRSTPALGVVTDWPRCTQAWCVPWQHMLGHPSVVERRTLT